MLPCTNSKHEACFIHVEDHVRLDVASRALIALWIRASLSAVHAAVNKRYALERLLDEGLEMCMAGEALRLDGDDELIAVCRSGNHSWLPVTMPRSYQKMWRQLDTGTAVTSCIHDWGLCFISSLGLGTGGASNFG